MPLPKGCTQFQSRNSGEDISVPRNWSEFGSRTALGGNGMSLGGLHHTTIYQWINNVGVCKDHAFLLSYALYGDRRWVFQRKGVCPKIFHIWDNMRQFPDMVSLVIKGSSTFHWKLTKMKFKLRAGRSKTGCLPSQGNIREFTLPLEKSVKRQGI